MKNVWTRCLFFLGFLWICTSLDAVETTIRESLFFGDKNSPIEIYLFTDWGCPACREIEPEIEEIASLLQDQAKLTFVDLVASPVALNYSPFNVTFMIKNKSRYFKLRHEMIKLALETSQPTEQQIEKIAHGQNVHYQPLHSADITLSQKYFKQLAQQFSVTHVPTLVIANIQTQKGKKLIGASEISSLNILKAIHSLNRNN